MILKFLPEWLRDGSSTNWDTEILEKDKFSKVMSLVLTTELWVFQVEKSRRQLNIWLYSLGDRSRIHHNISVVVLLGGSSLCPLLLPVEVSFLRCQKKRNFLRLTKENEEIFIWTELSCWVSKVPSPSVLPREKSHPVFSRARIKAISQSFCSTFA